MRFSPIYLIDDNPQHFSETGKFHHFSLFNWLFSNITRPTYLVFHFKASLIQLFFSSLYVKLTEERLHMSLSSPSVISHCLSLFSRPLFSFFSISFLPELCSVAQFFLPEMPQRISSLYLPFFPLSFSRCLSAFPQSVSRFNFFSFSSSIASSIKRQAGEPS